MDEQQIIELEKIIGYEFKDKNLLIQSFTRKSYSNEHKDIKNNECLEFIGDEAIDVIVAKKLCEKFGTYNNGFSFNPFDEGTMTMIKSNLVDRDTLSTRIKELGLSNFLLMSEGDKNEGVDTKDKTQEDLFESIIGAVVIDSKWNYEEIEKVIVKMLNLNYFLSNIQSFLEKKKDYQCLVRMWLQKENIYSKKLFSFNNEDKNNKIATIRISDEECHGEGDSQEKAKKDCFNKAYKIIKEKGWVL